MKKKSDFAAMIDTVIFEATASEDKEREVADIITFCEDPRFLDLLGQDPPFVLWEMQRIVLKLFYRGSRGNENLELTEREIGILQDIADNEELDYRQEQGGFCQVFEKYRRREIHNVLVMAMPPWTPRSPGQRTETPTGMAGAGSSRSASCGSPIRGDPP